MSGKDFNLDFYTFPCCNKYNKYNFNFVKYKTHFFSIYE